MSERKVIGLTGTIGSGKSKVLEYLSASIPVIDCDSINRQLLEKDHPGYRALQKAGLLKTKADGTIDRQAMADALFTDPSRRKHMESILHPLIIDALRNWIEEQSGLCAAEVPLLFECHLESLFDEVWTVTCSDAIALARLQAFRQIDGKEAKRRLALQMKPEEKIARSTRVICNNGTVEELCSAVAQALDAAGKTFNAADRKVWP